MNYITRRAALAGAAVLPMAVSNPARAQARFPERPIRLIVPWAAGGPADGGFRILAEASARKLGQPVVVENKAGASGVLGAHRAAGSAAGRLHGLADAHERGAAAAAQPALPYDPINDLTYILQITGFVMGVVVRADAPWRTLDELLAYAKANPGKLNFGTLGIGSTQHLAMERIGLAQGPDLDACALSRHGRHAARAAGRRDRLRLGGVGLDAAGGGRQAAPARDLHRRARQALPRRADACASRASTSSSTVPAG